MASILDVLPLFAKHGYKRREALDLPHWEFWDFVRAARKDEARQYVIDTKIALLAGGMLEESDGKQFITQLQKSADITDVSKHQGFEALKLLLG